MVNSIPARRARDHRCTSGDYTFNEPDTRYIHGHHRSANRVFTDITHASPGTYTVTIAAAGQSIGGKNFGEFLPVPDLSAFRPSRSAPASAGPRPTVDGFGWQVTNSGQRPTASGAWVDVVYLSPTSTLGTSSVLLTTVTHTGGLAPNANYTWQHDQVEPSGRGICRNYYVILFRPTGVIRLSRGPSGANKANNRGGFGFHADAQRANADFRRAGPKTHSPEPGQGRYYQITVAPGQTLHLALTSNAAASGSDRALRPSRRSSRPECIR